MLNTRYKCSIWATALYRFVDRPQLTRPILLITSSRANTFRRILPQPTNHKKSQQAGLRYSNSFESYHYWNSTLQTLLDRSQSLRVPSSLAVANLELDGCTVSPHNSPSQWPCTRDLPCPDFSLMCIISLPFVPTNSEPWKKKGKY